MKIILLLSLLCAAPHTMRAMDVSERVELYRLCTEAGISDRYLQHVCMAVDKKKRVKDGHTVTEPIDGKVQAVINGKEKWVSFYPVSFPNVVVVEYPIMSLGFDELEGMKELFKKN